MKTFIKQRLHEAFDGENLFYHGSPYLFDKFNIDKVGTGDGLSKYGYGLYFADLEETAIYYAKELSIGHLKDKGLNVYKVKLSGLDHFFQWEEEIPDYIHNNITSKLNKLGFSDDAETLEREYEEYGTFFTLRNICEFLEHVLGGKKEVSEFINICGVNGAIAQSPAHSGNVYVAYDDDIVKILGVDKI